MKDLNEFLADFEFIEADRLPSVTLDKNGRFNPNVAARRLIGIEPNNTVAIGYNPFNYEIVIIPSKFAVNLPEARLSFYNVDQRYYLSARAFAKNYNFIGRVHHFDYVRGMSSGEAFVFKLRMEDVMPATLFDVSTSDTPALPTIHGDI